MIKKAVKNLIGSVYSVFDYPIIVNSYGRSGSTVLTNSIIRSAIKTQKDLFKNIAYRSVSQEAWDLEHAELKNGIVYKTHDYPPDKEINNNIRMLYTFADPVDVVLSLLRLYDELDKEWMKQHYKHMKVPYSNFENILKEDQLQLENHLSSWLNEERFSIAFIKYEAMWDHQKDISNFLGFDIQLPPFRKRKAKSRKFVKHRSKIEKTYSTLRDKIEALDSFIANVK